MLLIAAALQEELNVALALFRGPKQLRHRGVEFWQSARGGPTVRFLRTGVGPKRAAASLERALGVLDVSRILVVGYAGALDPRLKLGTLVLVEKALACSLDTSDPAVESMKLDRAFVLAPDDSLAAAAVRTRLAVHSGDTLTSAHVWGNPEHKRILREKFGASVVDMETAALAGVAQNNGIPLSCARVISDEAEDSFLEPFAYDPSSGISERAGKMFRKGNPVKTYREWKRNASAARMILNELLQGYLPLIPE